MNNFENKVLNFIRENQMVNAGDKVIIGFSGGADSTALILVLFTLKEILKIEIIAAHVNHGIREEAGEDAEFTRKFCEEREIKYHLLEEDVPKIAADKRISEEERSKYWRSLPVSGRSAAILLSVLKITTEDPPKDRPAWI